MIGSFFFFFFCGSIYRVGYIDTTYSSNTVERYCRKGTDYNGLSLLFSCSNEREP